MIPNYLTKAGILSPNIFVGAIRYCKSYPADNYGDTCDICTDGHAINSAKTGCINPVLELLYNHCTSYSSANSACTACQTPYILKKSDNTCVLMEDFTANC